MFCFSLIAGFALALHCRPEAQNAPVSISAIESMIRSQQYDQALIALKPALRGNPGRLQTLDASGDLPCVAGKRQCQPSLRSTMRFVFHPITSPLSQGEMQILYKTGDKRAVPLLERMLKSDPGECDRT